jgi:enoyl-CoA hydratase
VTPAHLQVVTQSVAQHQVGLVNRVAEPGRALEEAVSLAKVIADNAPLAVVGSKHILMNAGDWGMSDGWVEQAATADAVSSSEDAQEGARAFAERRAPQWQGR